MRETVDGNELGSKKIFISAKAEQLIRDNNKLEEGPRNEVRKENGSYKDEKKIDQVLTSGLKENYMTLEDYQDDLINKDAT